MSTQQSETTNLIWPAENELPANSANRSAIQNILNDMVGVLPPERQDKPQFRGCLILYGRLKTSFANAATSETPIVEYREFQKLVPALRHKLNHISPNKGLPEKMASCLNDLAKVVDAIIQLGPNGIAEMHTQDVKETQKKLEEGIEDLKVTPIPAPVKMIPETRVAEYRKRLKEEKEKSARLISENNELSMKLRATEGQLSDAKRELQRLRGC